MADKLARIAIVVLFRGLYVLSTLAAMAAAAIAIRFILIANAYVRHLINPDAPEFANLCVAAAAWMLYATYVITEVGHMIVFLRSDKKDRPR